jgi:type I restriction enzyme R subunit
VESHDHAIRLKAEIMVDHFHEQVMAAGKIGGQARAMVVTSGIERAIQYFHAFKAYLAERKSPYQAIVAFSGEHDYNGAKVSEASLNGFSSSDIAGKIQTDPYRFLICADKFQTGYDEPLLHTMYVDKPLAGIKAVQTLSRLNRAHPQKHDCFVLDFQNNSEAITFAFQDYYRTTCSPRRPTPTSCTTSRRRWMPRRSTRPSRCSSWWRCSSAARTATGSTRSSMPAWRSMSSGSTRTARWTSRARPRCSAAPTPSCRR